MKRAIIAQVENGFTLKLTQYENNNFDLDNETYVSRTFVFTEFLEVKETLDRFYHGRENLRDW